MSLIKDSRLGPLTSSNSVCTPACSSQSEVSNKRPVVRHYVLYVKASQCPTPEVVAYVLLLQARKPEASSRASVQSYHIISWVQDLTIIESNAGSDTLERISRRVEPAADNVLDARRIGYCGHIVCRTGKRRPVVDDRSSIICFVDDANHVGVARCEGHRAGILVVT